MITDLEETFSKRKHSALSRLCRNRTLRLAALAIAAASLSACSYFGMLAKESALSLTERRGLQSFTLIGDLPANFGLRVTAWYYPVDEDGLNCQKSIIYTDRSKTRERGKHYDMPIDLSAQLSKRKIPLKHYIGACEMKLVKIDMYIDGRYGEQRWQKSSNNSVFYVHDSPDQVTVTDNFNSKGHLQVDARCTWSFGESNLELSKSLTCQGVGADLKLDQLAGNSVTLAVAVNPEERPAYGKWIKFQNGWKPCLLKEAGWGTCQKPPTFKTFKMNGQTCTVYPGCTE